MPEAFAICILESGRIRANKLNDAKIAPANKIRFLDCVLTWSIFVPPGARVNIFVSGQRAHEGVVSPNVVSYGFSLLKRGCGVKAYDPVLLAVQGPVGMLHSPKHLVLTCW